VPGYRRSRRRADSEDRDLRRAEAEIDNWRWAGVPFYLRTGKRLAARAPRSPSSSEDMMARDGRRWRNSYHHPGSGHRL
jgi:glucose-6-phosphate 1-dehydrogenase